MLFTLQNLGTCTELIFLVIHITKPRYCYSVEKKFESKAESRKPIKSKFL